MVGKIRALVYSAGLYKMGILFGLPAYHIVHQLTTDSDKQMSENRVLNQTKGEYVAITGSTDGIGKGLLLEFANRGYGIYQLSRNKLKMQGVEAEILGKTNLPPKSIVVDFSKAGEKEYIEAFSEGDHHKPGEVSILVNNVGMSATQVPFLQLDPELIGNVIKTNIFSQVMMTKHFIEEAKKYRYGKKSYIIYLSSVAADIRNPMSGTLYQSTKLQNRIFANYVYYPQSLDIEYMIVKPGWVSTPMTGHTKVGIVCSSLDEEVKAIFNSIGFTRETYAQIKHLWMIMGINMIPTGAMLYANKYIKAKKAAEMKQ